MKTALKSTVILAGLLLIGFLAIGCEAEEVTDEPEEQEEVVIEEEGAEEEEVNDYFTVTDMAGRTVQVPAEINKAATLCGCAHRFLVHLEAAEMISGVRESEKREPLRSPWNMAIVPDIFDIPVISGEDAETIIAVNPDIIIATQTADGFDFFEHEELADKTGLPLIILRPYVSFSAHRENVFESYRVLGEVLDREERAEELVNGIKSIIDDLDERTAAIPDQDKPTVYVGGKAWAGSMGLTSTSSIYTAFDFINASNVAEEVGEENAFIDKEALLMWNPDYIFLEATGFEQSLEELKEPQFATLSAVQNNNIYRIHPKIWTNTNHETVLVNAYYIGSVIYPDQFGDVDFTEKADQIYTLYLGKSVLNDMIDVHGAYERVEIN